MSLGRSRYMLYKKIARGGMAEIYLGKHIGEDGFERICCIKRILPHYAQDHDFIEMFRDEAHICKRLQHANIVRVEGFEEVDGSYAIIMEYINGGDLRTVLSHCEREGGRLSVPMALYITAEAARGLHYAHTRVDEVSGRALEIVHRDISPQNILLSYEGEVKVTDFGIADADNKATETKPGIVKGKYSYMSPEQISAKTVDARTDVFALSIVLWEMLAMKRLFQGENEVMTIQMVRTCTVPPSLMEFNPEVDEELQRIIYRGLSKEARDRYNSAADFELALRHYISRNHANFTTADLGNFLKKLLHKRRKEGQEEIKALLSGNSGQTQQQASRKPATEMALSADEAVAGASLRVKPEYTNIAVRGQAASYGKVQAAAPRRSPSPAGNPAGSSSAAGDHHQRARAPRAAPTAVQRPYRSSRSSAASSSGSSWVWVLLALAGLAFAGFAGLQLKRTRASVPSQLSVSSIPEWVKLELDGEPLYQGAYVRTPVNIDSLNPGEHKLVLRRRDYEDETYRFKVTPGEKLKPREFVLGRKGEQAPMRVGLAPDQRSEKVKIRIDDGLYENELDARTPQVDVSHFLTGRELSLVVTRVPSGEAFRCGFTPRATTWQAPFIVLLHPDKQSCSYPPR